MSKIPVGCELYSVRYALAEDMPGTVKAVADMGYDGVEFFGEPQHSAEAYKQALDDAGTICCGWHTPFSYMQEDRLAQTIEFNQIIGNKRLIVPGIPPEYRQTLADWRNLADWFSATAEKLEPFGMVTGYHNHTVEFEELDGGIPWHTLFDNASNKVLAQLDNGHAYRAGANVVETVMRYPGQGKSIHLKPYARALGQEDQMRGYDPLIGDDEIPWEAFFTACETIGGVEWYIIEYESNAYPELEAVDKCLQALRAMGK
jgi:sugar phosphate isomerase/epimerase